MSQHTAQWDVLGALPSCSEIEEQIASITIKNDHPPVNEEVWMERGRKFAAGFQAAEKEILDIVYTNIKVS